MSDLIDVLAAELAYLRRERDEAAKALTRRAHVALYHACNAGSMMAMHLIDDAQEQLDEAAASLCGDLASRARDLAAECRETMRGAIGYVVTLEQLAAELLSAIDIPLGEAA